MTCKNSAAKLSADFIAIDFETASHERTSACSVGIAAVKDMAIVETFYALIRPKAMHFEDGNIAIHGISPEMVEEEQAFDEIWPQISKYFTEHVPVVAHNASFDMSVLKKSLGYEPQEFFYLDTIALASKHVDGSKSLDHCAEVLGVCLDNHHNAEDDAIACAEIVIEILNRSNCRTIWEFLVKTDNGGMLHRISDLHQSDIMPKKAAKARKWEHHTSPSEICRTVDCVDPNSPLCNANIVFTGELSISRREAMQIAVDHGAVVKSSVSKKTNYLVVGTQDKEIVGEDGLSTKEEKAIELNNSGKANIVILHEDDFLLMAGLGATL